MVRFELSNSTSISAFVLVALSGGCSGSADTGGTGGTISVAGATSTTGGSTTPGETTSTTGGTIGIGGVASGTGGAKGITGGSPSATGGVKSLTGGSPSISGGSTNTGGTTGPSSGTSLTYPIVDTNQTSCFKTQSSTTCPSSGAAYFGQDAQYQTAQPSYKINGDGTVTDNITGLMWNQDPGDKMVWSTAVAGAKTCTTGGYADWRTPTIKELYSLILFSGGDVSGLIGNTSVDTSTLNPFIDKSVFVFEYGGTGTTVGTRIIDSQWTTSTIYTDHVMGNNNSCFFGVNFADGRIKCYPTSSDNFTMYVRGNPSYGINQFQNSGDGTIYDAATGLTWQQGDYGSGLVQDSNSTGIDWPGALSYCETLTLGGANDWRLPSAKELQSIVDYTRSPASTSSPAVDPLFSCSKITNEAGVSDYAYYWTSTTHMSWQGGGSSAVYISFGRAIGYWNSVWQDVHGAGAQRSDAKVVSASSVPYANGPQGDAVRSFNFVRCVRGGNAIQL